MLKENSTLIMQTTLIEKKLLIANFLTQSQILLKTITLQQAKHFS